MKVILLKSVPKVGKKGDVVEVNQGYAQNSLFPKKLAIPATDSATKDVERRKQNAITERAVKLDLLDRAIESLNESNLVMKLPANEQGSLFQKIHEKDIAEFLESNNRVSIDPKCIILPDGPIKKIGSYEVKIVEGDYKSKLNLTITKK
jgi:large subunit ribosomal protein L9